MAKVTMTAGGDSFTLDLAHPAIAVEASANPQAAAQNQAMAIAKHNQLVQSALTTMLQTAIATGKPVTSLSLEMAAPVEAAPTSPAKSDGTF